MTLKQKEKFLISKGNPWKRMVQLFQGSRDVQLKNILSEAQFKDAKTDATCKKQMTANVHSYYKKQLDLMIRLAKRDSK